MVTNQLKDEALEIVLRQEPKTALTYHEIGKTAQALSLLQTRITNCKKKVGTKHIYTAYALKNLAQFHQVTQNYTDAVANYQQAFQIVESLFGKNHSTTKKIQDSYFKCQLEMLMKIPLKDALAVIPAEMSEQFIQLREQYEWKDSK
ncbi:MAG: tetratricopeptide repeat protein [Microcystaceae cyanobacterium]